MYTINKRTGLIIFFGMVFCFQTAAVAMDHAYSFVGHADLKTLIEADSRNFLLVDSRNPKEYLEPHIPGAVHLP